LISKRKDFLSPFKTALGGLVYAFKTQRHMRFHLYVVMVVVIMGLTFGLPRREMLVLFFVIALVLVAEMFNSAIEATVDLVQPTYHPLAKLAKDLAAGAVLITTFSALLVGAVLFMGEDRWEQIRINLTTDTLGIPAVQRLIIGAFLLFLAVVIGKGLGKRGQVFKGGLVSGHAAFGFFFATTIVLFSGPNVLITALAVLLALIVAQSRFEAKIHSIFELSLGAAVGVIMALILFAYVPK